MDPFSHLVKARFDNSHTQPAFTDEEITCINRVLLSILNTNHLLSSNLKDWLRDPVKLYINFIEGKHISDFEQLKDLSTKCQLVALNFDFFNLESISQVFKNKQPHNIEKYI